MEKRTGETLYVCEKCGAYFLIEEACKMHERNCDGAWRGEAAAAELTEELKRIRFETGYEIETPEGNSALEAVYNKETRKIVIISF